jgi:hypothetical protein
MFGNGYQITNSKQTPMLCILSTFMILDIDVQVNF